MDYKYLLHINDTQQNISVGDSREIYQNSAIEARTINVPNLSIDVDLLPFSYNKDLEHHNLLLRLNY